MNLDSKTSGTIKDPFMVLNPEAKCIDLEVNELEILLSLLTSSML